MSANPIPDSSNIFKDIDLQLYKSGEKTGNCLGGKVHVDRVGFTMHSLFNMVSTTERDLGKSKYRCVYLKNRNAIISALNPKLYMPENTKDSGTEIYFGFDKLAGVGDGKSTGIAQQIPDESTAPLGVVFSKGEEPETGVSLGGDIPPGEYIPIWIRLVITAGTDVNPRDGAFLVIQTNNEQGVQGIPANPVDTDILVIGEIDQNQHYSDLIERVKKRTIDWFVCTGNISDNDDPSAWINMLGILKDKTSFAFGNMDATTIQEKNKIITALTPANPSIVNGYSFKVLRNVYMIFMDTTQAFINPSPQYDFITQHLKLARLKSGIDFIIVFSNKVFYATTSGNRPEKTIDDKLRRTYHQLFVDYGVHVVISAQFRNYQRQHVLGYNPSSTNLPSKFFIEQAPNYMISTGQRFFGEGTGCLFVSCGTGGQRPLDTWDFEKSYTAFKHRLINDNSAGYIMLKSQMRKPSSNPKLTGSYYELFKPPNQSKKIEILRDSWTIEVQK